MTSKQCHLLDCLVIVVYLIAYRIYKLFDCIVEKTAIKINASMSNKKVTLSSRQHDLSISDVRI